MVDSVRTPSVDIPTVTTQTSEYDGYMAEASKKVLTIMDQPPPSDTGDGTQEPGKPVIPSPGLSPLDVANMLASIKSAINDSMTGIAKENIEINRAEQSKKAAERIEQLQKAAESLKKASTWGLLGKILGWVIPAIMVVAGAALAIAGAAIMATGVGAAGGVALLGIGASLIAGGVVGLVAQTLQETGAAKAIMDWMANIFESMGMSKEAAMWTSLIVYQVTIMAIMIAASLGAGAAVGAVGGLVGGGAGAASAAAGAGAQAAATAASTAAQTASNIAVNAIKVAVAACQALAQVTQAGVSLGQAYNEKEAADHEADAQSINAVLKKLQQKLEEQEDQLKEVIESYQKGIDIVMGIIETQGKMAQQVMQV